MTPYLEGFRLNHRPKSVVSARGRLAKVEGRLSNVVLSDLTEDRVRAYIRQRKDDGASGRTINMEVGELSRAIGHQWSLLWPKVRKLEERKDVGKALSPDEQSRLLDGLEKCLSPTLRTLIPILLLTGMRSGEALSLQWCQVDLLSRTITVGRAKTSSGTGRVLPVNDDLAHVLATHRLWFVENFGEPLEKHFLFPWGSPPMDPSRHASELKRSWQGLRMCAGLTCRLHDLRHTFATGLAESGATESTMLALMGHMSRAMLERYSHIRMVAKHDAVAGMRLRPHGVISPLLPVNPPVATLGKVIQ